MWLTTVVAVAFLVIPLAVGGWTVLSNQGLAAASPWPSQPRLTYSFEANGSTERTLAVFVDGSADDFYVADRGNGTSRVTRYVSGEERWQTEVGFEAPKRLDVIDNRIFLSSSKDSDDAQFDRLDPETGEVMWSIGSAGLFDYKIIENRLFVIKLVNDEDLDWTLFEYDIDAGTEVNRSTGMQFDFIEDGIVALDDAELTLGMLDLDFQPVGERVSIEPSWVEFFDPLWSHYENGWVYFSDRTDFGGTATTVGLSETGETQFECETVVDEPHEVEVRDGSTLIVSGVHEAEVLDIDGSTCTSRWHIDPGDRTFVRFEQYPVAVNFPGTKEEIDFLLDDRDISVLDWDTGQPIATGNGFFLFNDAGEWMTSKDDVMIARTVESGDELWQIAAPNGTIPWAAQGWVAVVRQGPRTSTINVYTD